MMSQPRQLTLDLPHRSALGMEDFFVSQANAAAVEMIDAWPEWSHWALVVTGPRGAGKSHLAHVWQSASNASSLQALDLSEDAVARFGDSGALVVEDLERGIGDETVLFHLLNLAREHKLSILLTSRVAPGELSISLPDLRSRLRALPVAPIEAPDEALLNAVLVKLFSDRQLLVEPLVISYLMVRMERSMEGADKVVSAIDRLALEQQRRVTRPLAQEALAGLTSQKMDD